MTSFPSGISSKKCRKESFKSYDYNHEKNTELTRATKRFNYVLGVIEEQVQTPLPERLKPIDVHIGFDADCAAAEPTHVKNARNVRGFNYKNGAGKGAICLNSNIKTILTGYSSFSHEIMHLYLFKRRKINEVTLSEAVVTAIRNHWLFRKPQKKRVCDYSSVNSRNDTTHRQHNQAAVGTIAVNPLFLKQIHYRIPIQTWRFAQIKVAAVFVDLRGTITRYAS